MTAMNGKKKSNSPFPINNPALRFTVTMVFLFLAAAMLHCTGQHGVVKEQLGPSDDRAKQSAVKELNALDGPSKKKRLGALKKMLYDKNPDNQVLAAESLGRMGPEAEDAVPDLVEVLNGENVALRASAVRALGGIGTAAVPSLITVLHHQDSTLRNSAADALGSIGPAAQEAVPELARMLRDQEHDSSRHAASALGLIGFAAVPALTQVAGQGDRYATDMAITAFSYFKSDPAVVHELVQLLANAGEDPGVRSFAARALGAMHEKAEEAMPDLARALGDQEREVGNAARWAFGQIGPRAIPALKEALSSSDPRVRFNAAFALGSLGPAAEETVPLLLQALNDKDRTVRVNAILAIGKMRVSSQAVVQALVHVLEADEDELVRLDALRVLNAIGTPEAKEAVRKYNNKNDLR